MSMDFHDAKPFWWEAAPREAKSRPATTGPSSRTSERATRIPSRTRYVSRSSGKLTRRCGRCSGRPAIGSTRRTIKRWTWSRGVCGWWRGPAMALVIAFACYLPNLLWNLEHAFVSYKHTADNANLAGAAAVFSGLIVDSTAPGVVSVSANPASGNIEVGQTITFTLGFSAPVAVAGAVTRPVVLSLARTKEADIVLAL